MKIEKLFLTILAVTLLFCLMIQKSPGQIAVNAVTTSTGDISSRTFSHTVAGENRLLIVGISLESGASDKRVTSVSYAGQSLTRLDEKQSPGGDPRADVWYLVNPPTGTNNVTVTLQNSNKVGIGAISFTGVDQTNPVSGVVTGGGSSGTPNLSVSSKSGDLVMDVVASLASSISPGSGQTQRWNLDMGGSGKRGGASTKSGASSTSMTWSGSEKWAGVGFSINVLQIPTKVSFEQQPTGTSAGENIDPAVTVQIEDEHENLVTDATNQVTISLGSNPGGGTLSGTLSVNASGGIATFSNLSINKTGEGYTLIASAAGLTSDTSSPFNLIKEPIWRTDDQKTATLTSGSSISVNSPDNLAEGNLIIVVVSTRDGSEISASDPDFKLIRQESAATSGNDRPTTAAFYKIATADEPVSYTFTRTGTTRDWRIVAGRVTGHYSANPIGVHSGANSGDSDVGSLVVPQLTTSDDNVLMIAAASTHNTNTITGPGGMDELWDEGSLRPAYRGVSEIRTTAGATGSRTFTFSSNNKSSALMFEILPLIEEPPGPPDDPTYSDILISSVRVNWTLPATGGAPELYRIERAPDLSGSPGTFTEIATTDELFYNDSDVLPGNMYWYRVRGENSYGLGDYSNPTDINIVAGVPVWHTADQKTASGSGSSISVDRPDNVSAGDLIIVVTQARDGGTIEQDGSYFTLVRHESGNVDKDLTISAVWSRIAVADEPASYGFTRTDGDARDWRGIAGRVTGHNPITPTGNHSGVNSGSSKNESSVTIPSITTSRDNTLLLAIMTVAREKNASGINHPSGMTAEWTFTGSSNTPASAGSTERQETEGDTGTRQYSWTGTDGASGVMFEILPISQPMITVVNPDEGAQGATGVEFTVTGTDFRDTPTISFSGLGITVTNVIFGNTTELTVTIDIAQGTTIGNRNITIENPDGGTVTAVDAFTVAPGPVFTSVNPEGLAQWASGVDLTITGSNFQVTPAVSFSGTGIDVTAITRDSDTLLTITVDIAQDAVTGNRDITIQNPDGGTITASDAFTVHPGPVVETTTITASPAAIPADGEYMSTITVHLKDADGNNVSNGGYTVTLTAMAGTLSDITENHDGAYTATLTSSTTASVVTVTGTLNALSINDDAEIEFYAKQDVMVELSGNAGWRMLASPVIDLPVSDISGSIQITGYDEPREFKNFFTGYNGLRFMAPADLSGNLSGGKGFIVYPTTLPVVIQTNGFAQPDDVTVSMHADGNGLNLLGNPFTSSFDITQIIPVDGSLISSVGQIWKPDTLSSAGGSFVLTTDPAVDGIIAPWQGFFIENDNATGITLPLPGKSSASRDVIQKTPSQPVRGLIALTFSGNDEKRGITTSDRAAIIYFHENATDDWDLWDASKFYPLSSPFAVLSFSGEREGKTVHKAQESRPYHLTDPVEIPVNITVQNMN